MEVAPTPTFHSSVEAQNKVSASPFVNVNTQAFEVNATTSSLGPSHTNVSSDGRLEPDGASASDTAPSSPDAALNGRAAAIARTSGMTGSTLHQIINDQGDGSFDTSLINSSQLNDLVLVSSITSSSPLIVNPAQQPPSPKNIANDHSFDQKATRPPSLSGTAHSSLIHKDDVTLEQSLPHESRQVTMNADGPMDVSEPAQSNPPNSDGRIPTMDSQPDTKIVLPSLELPHHPPAPPSIDAVTDVLNGTLFHANVSPVEDFIMRDAPKSPGKIVREREDEAEEGPAAKRSRTELETSKMAQFKVPELPHGNSQQHVPLVSTSIGTNGSHLVTVEVPPGLDLSQPLIKAQHKSLLKIVQNVRRTKDATAFNKAVDPVALNIPSYPDIIIQPMDLSKIESNLRDNQYPSAAACVRDFELVIQNCITFNGPDHLVSQAALKLKPSFEKHLANLPGLDTADASVEKKSKKPAVAPKIAPPRRESRSSLGGNARSPSTANNQQTFALGPSGVPLIRRDSTAQDGRPKREIHPPAPRDLPYANQKPKKKKYQLELRFCQELLGELKKGKYQSVSWPFAQPVDPVALNIPHYHNVIKKPMDLSTIDKKLAAGQYENAKEFEADVRLMFSNCYRFNPEGNAIHRLGKDFEDIFTEKWADKKQYLEDHTAPSGPQTPGTSPEPQDDEEEEDDEPEDEISVLQKQILAMSKQMEMIQKKKGSPPISTKKPTKGGKAAKRESKKTATPSSFKSEKKNGAKHAKREKIPYVTYEQKQDISNRINNLPAPRMATALTIIRDNMPNLKGVQEDEIELDIDELSNDVLYKLLGFVRKYAPRPNDSPPARQAPAPAPVQAPHPKKNKPMSKNEQESRIREIQTKLSRFENAGSDQSPEPEVKPNDDTSGDEDDSEESEED